MLKCKVRMIRSEYYLDFVQLHFAVQVYKKQYLQS